MQPESLVRVKSALQAFFAEKGLRRTAQREAIVEAAFGTAEHFTADELLARSRELDPTVSRATVYRTLPLLVESGMLKEIDLREDRKVYDPNFVEHPHHNHLICVDCSKIIEFEDTNIELLENCITRRLGFSPTSKMVKIEAHCDRLKAEGACANRPATKGPARKGRSKQA
jgi:Fur family ferric uptake transcriptional regulator